MKWFTSEVLFFFSFLTLIQLKKIYTKLDLLERFACFNSNFILDRNSNHKRAISVTLRQIIRTSKTILQHVWLSRRVSFFKAMTFARFPKQLSVTRTHFPCSASEMCVCDVKEISVESARNKRFCVYANTHRSSQHISLYKQCIQIVFSNRCFDRSTEILAIKSLTQA